jgi:hypothetical protein
MTASSASLIARAKRIILEPRSEWHVIDGERTSVRELYLGYIMPLAAIPPLAGMIGMTVFGLGRYFKVPIVAAITGALVQYVLALVAVYVLALIVDALAPTFGGTKDQLQALKVCAYASTASWLAGVFGIFPMLAILSLLGLYSLYLIYLGLPVLMKVPQDKALGYTVAVIVSAIVLFMVAGYIATRFVGYPGMMSPIR